MKRINSKFTFLLKRIFPFFWLGILIFISTLSLSQQQSIESMAIGLSVVVFMATIGFFIFKILLSNLIDEVYLNKDTLVFKNSGEQIQLSFDEIIDYHYQRYMNPHKVTLYTKVKTKFGKKLCFLAPTTFVPFKKNEELMKLIKKLTKAN